MAKEVTLQRGQEREVQGLAAGAPALLENSPVCARMIMSLYLISAERLRRDGFSKVVSLFVKNEFQ